jgi:hypothetical protein
MVPLKDMEGLLARLIAFDRLAKLPQHGGA